MNIRQRVVREALGQTSHLYTVPVSQQPLVPGTPPPPITIPGAPPAQVNPPYLPPSTLNQFSVPVTPTTQITTQPRQTTAPSQTAAPSPTHFNSYTAQGHRYTRPTPPPPPPQDYTAQPSYPGNVLIPPTGYSVPATQNIPPCGVPQNCQQRQIPWSWWHRGAHQY